MSVAMTTNRSSEAERSGASYESLPSTTKYVPQGREVYTHGDEASTIYRVKKGLVALREWCFRDIVADPKERCFGIRGPGETFGALHGHSEHEEEALATTDCELWVYQASVIPNELLITELRRQIVGYREFLAMQGLSSQQIARMLHLLKDKYFHDDDSGVPMTHQTLALLTNSSRETVTRELGKMCKKGMISQSRKKITILDQNKLAEQAGHEKT